MEMDELKLILTSGFTKRIVTKIIAKAIKKKTGYDIDIELNEITMEMVGQKVRLHVDVKAEMHGDDLLDLVKSKDLI